MISNLEVKLPEPKTDRTRPQPKKVSEIFKEKKLKKQHAKILKMIQQRKAGLL